jgi:hypothetical protein
MTEDELWDEIGRLIQMGDEAKERARRPHDLKAGACLLEARTHFPDEAQFKDWVRHRFRGRMQRALKAMQMALDHERQNARELEAARAAGYI